ncbi:MAG: Bor family protein [Gemmatimonadota bacterium]|nr:Bor family protein [Gemmatimonadota bacterium]MDH3421937.1 Bor family protein [Gemmatimonadota bacterium]
MIRSGRAAVTLGLMLVTTACYEHTYTVGLGAPTGAVVYEEWHNHWLGGLIGERNIDVALLCPSGNATIHNEQSFLNGLVEGLTVGIYAPTTVKILCRSGGSGDLGLSPDQVSSILTSPAFLQRVGRLLPGRLEEAQLGVEALQEDAQD